MSLVCHTITSHYTAQEGDTIEKDVDKEEQDSWVTEKSFGNARRLHSKTAPAFVRATVQCDEYGMPTMGTGDIQADRGQVKDPLEVSEWYRNLTERGREKVFDQRVTAVSRGFKAQTEAPGRSYSEDLNINTIKNSDSSGNITPAIRQSRANWFTSHPPTHNATPTSKPSTLADILSRNPPPLPSEPTFTSPVFLFIGPANRGFQMLQKKGWQEGEGLGSGRVEKKRVRAGLRANQVKEEDSSAFSSTEVIDLTLDDSDGEKTTTSRAQEVVDLTLHSDSESGDDDDDDAICSDDHYNDQNDTQSPEPHAIPTTSGIALITPLPTTLKADRLGIGLKARRHSKAKAKAITHTSAALAAHIRAANQMKKEKGRFGKGWRGLARKNKRAERERVGMLKYLND
ncbi:hypothetical protein BU17DRAFT_101722 [Hysterangium stoloniferum]|nr:hypothetical protein BU17DRAFT_101722 [Hysterangium stoloniferum]